MKNDSQRFKNIEVVKILNFTHWRSKKSTNSVRTLRMTSYLALMLCQSAPLAIILYNSMRWNLPNSVGWILRWFDICIVATGTANRLSKFRASTFGIVSYPSPKNTWTRERIINLPSELVHYCPELVWYNPVSGDETSLVRISSSEKSESQSIW
jgi:hypothetical protein